MQRYAKAAQPDLILSVYPYKMDEFSKEAIAEEDGDPSHDAGNADSVPVKALRKLMRQILIKGEENDFTAPVDVF